MSGIGGNHFQLINSTSSRFLLEPVKLKGNDFSHPLFSHHCFISSLELEPQWGGKAEWERKDRDYPGLCLE